MLRNFNFNEKMIKLVSSPGFNKFYSDLSNDWYKELKEGYRKHENEEKLVERIVTSANNKGFKNIKLYSKFIHGSKSQVKFNYKGNITQREIGDMAIITVVSEKRERLFQRLCFIQNKVGKKGKQSTTWSVDQAQLHILKHFPPLTGVSGIIPKDKTITFSNFSDCLGAYGLFKHPGEMIFASANLTHTFQKGRKSINSKNIIAPLINPFNNTLISFILLIDPQNQQLLNNYSYLPLYHYNHTQFLGNVIYTDNLHDFTKNWIHVNIGEFTFFDRNILNYAADSVANSMMSEIGMSEYINIPPTDDIIVDLENSSLGIIALHIDISKE